jgi:hypothetical protein
VTGAQFSGSLQAAASGLTAPRRMFPIRRDRGNLVPRQNYRQVKKQKELSRKARQLEKQQRRTARPQGSAEIATPLQDSPAAPNDPTLSGGT